MFSIFIQPLEAMLKLITVCLWSLFSACKLADSCGIILTVSEAEARHLDQLAEKWFCCLAFMLV